MSPRPRTLRTLVLAAAAGVFARAAHADERTEARRHFRAGIALVSQRQFQRAIEEFQTAYATLPNANVLFNIARAYSDLGDVEHAIEYYQRYLQADVADRSEVEATVRDLERRRRAAAPAETASTTPSTTTATTPGAPLAAQIEALQSAVRALVQLTQGGAAAPATGTTPAAPTTPATPAPEAPAATTEDTYEERVVTAALSEQNPVDAPNATTIITAQDIRLSGLRNVAEMLRRAVGVDVMTLDEGDQQVGIRGFNRRLANRVLVLVDGRSIYMDFLGVTFWSMLPVDPEEIERIEVIRGAGSALYGADAYSGVINILTRAPGEGRNSVTVGGGNGAVVHASATNSGRAGGVSFRSNVGYDQGQTFGRLTGPTDATYRVGAPDPNVALRNLHADVDLRASLGRGVTLRGGVAMATGGTWFNAIGPLRRFWTDLTLLQPYLQVDVGGFSARAFMNHAAATAGQVIEPVGAQSLDDRMFQDVVDVEARYRRGWRFGSVALDLTFGGSWRAKYISWSFLDRDHLLNFFAGYVQAGARFGEHFAATASLRLDQHPVLDAPMVSPRLALIYKPTPRRSLRLTGATAFRTPTMLELYLNLANPSPLPGVSVQAQGGEVFQGGSQRLSAESAITADLGWQDHTSDRFQYEVGGYVTRGTGLITLGNVAFDPLPGSTGSGGLVDVGTFHFVNDPLATWIAGVEAAVRVSPVEGLDLFANYTFAYTRQESGGNMDGDQRTPQHKLNVGAQVRTRFGLVLELTGHYVSSQVWREQDFDVSRGVVYGTYPLDAYFLLNGRVGFRTLRDRLEFAVTGTNLTDNHARQHPFGAPLGARVLGSITVRY